MSYILEAIRKSDQQRQRGAAPTVLTAPTAEAPPKRSAFLIYGLLAAALIGAGMVIGWLRPWQPEQPAAVAVAAKPYELGSRQVATVSLSALPETAVKPASAAQPPLQKPMPTAQPAPAPADVAARLDLPAPTKTVVPSVPSTVTDPAQERKVMTTAELPTSIQQEIPKMAISLHAFSGKPAERLVSINDRLLREGDSLAEGLKLEQITPDGMTFSYKGYRFHRGIR